MDSIRTVRTHAWPGHLFTCTVRTVVICAARTLHNVCPSAAFRPKPRLLRLQAKPAALCLAVHCCLVSQWHRSLSRPWPIAPLRCALPCFWTCPTAGLHREHLGRSCGALWCLAVGGSLGPRNLTFAGYYVDLLDFLRICLVAAAWWRPWSLFASGRGWKLLGLPGLPADLPGGWVVTALVTFCCYSIA